MPNYIYMYIVCTYMNIHAMITMETNKPKTDVSESFQFLSVSYWQVTHTLYIHVNVHKKKRR